jgi:Ca-activated chloride channel family protein
MYKFRALILVSALLLLATALHADTGVIIPKSFSDRPDPSVLSLRQMKVDIRISGQFATVRMTQIFQNHRDRDLEGQYVFRTPEGAEIANFAIWEDGQRIPGVVIERKRARELYEELTFMKVDPGLLEQEEGNEQLFSLEIYPIPAHGTKRVEIEYTLELPVISLQSEFVFSLRPDFYQMQKCEHFDLSFELDSQIPLSDFRLSENSLPLQIAASENQNRTGKFSATDYAFEQDFSCQWSVDAPEHKIGAIAYRELAVDQNRDPLRGESVQVDPYGYLAVTSVLNSGEESQNEAREIVLLVDTSLSMQWHKLEQTYKALEYFLTRLSSADSFTLITFNDEIRQFSPTLQQANTQNISAALGFFKASYLMGGTDLLGGITSGLGIFDKRNIASSRAYLVVISDGSATLEERSNAAILETVRQANTNDIRLMTFAIGDDADRTIMEKLAAEHNGAFASAGDTEDLTFKLTSFFDRLDEQAMNDAVLTTSGALQNVYRSENGTVFDRSQVTYIGRYLEPRNDVELKFAGEMAGKAVDLGLTIDLPERATENSSLPRRWAILRVNDLLDRINLATDPESKQSMIAEVTKLAIANKLITPYTSFLAAPRSNLSPEMMRAGDPILRVQTAASVKSVVVMFPFGLIKPLHFVADDNAWETRFLAPATMQDGRYFCTLLMTDGDGKLYRENKAFTIDNKPPTLKIELDREAYLPGQEVEVLVFADRDTRNIYLHLDQFAKSEASYISSKGGSIGRFRIPADYLPGVYKLRVTAVDFARNSAVKEIELEILPAGGEER